MARKQKPRFGQNFLTDEHAQLRIVDALGDLAGRTVIEIGPGHGALTSHLVSRAHRVIAVELDPTLARELAFTQRLHSNLTIHQADILSTDFGQIAPEAPAIDVIGNLPYYITSDILLHLFAASRTARLRRAVLMMQREVADRISAAPGVRDYGMLSATTQLYADAQTLFTLPPAAFSPPPDVYSTVVRLDFTPRFQELGVEPVSFERFLRICFAQKRKTLANNLRAGGFAAAAIEEACHSVQPPLQSPMVRAESVGLAAIAGLFRSLQAS